MSGVGLQLVVATDRTSNGPSLTYPAPSRQGGAPQIENWVLDNFHLDPWAANSMIFAGEAAAKEVGVCREELDVLIALRWQQYTESLAGDRAFQRRYMVPAEIPRKKGEALTLDADEGVRPKEMESIVKLRPVRPDGLHTFATQAHSADGCAGAVVTTVDQARELSGGEGVVRLLGAGFARDAKSRMPMAPVPAALSALDAANKDIKDIAAVTSHNPFAVNDLYFSAETGIAADAMNIHGSSLIFGYPQGPTGLRSIAELAKTLRERGGGIGLFTGCAAGGIGAELVLEITDCLGSVFLGQLETRTIEVA